MATICLPNIISVAGLNYPIVYSVRSTVCLVYLDYPTLVGSFQTCMHSCGEHDWTLSWVCRSHEDARPGYEVKSARSRYGNRLRMKEKKKKGPIYGQELVSRMYNAL